MRSWILIVGVTGILCAVGASVAFARQASGGTGDVELIERALAQAIADRDVRTYDRLVADDYVVIDASGAENTKADIIRAYKEDRVKRTVNISDVKVRIFGNTATVTGSMTESRVVGERVVPTVVRYIRVYSRRNGIWRAVLQMSMEVPPPQR